MVLFRAMRLVAFVLCLTGGGVRAEGTDPTDGQVVLTVTGLDEASYPGGTQQFDLDMLRSLGQVEIRTSSIWTEGRPVFTGVLLSDLAQALQISGARLRLHALNDYQIEFPLDDATEEAPILAYWMDGAPMSVRDKGPLWVIYPYDAAAKYRTDTTFSRSIWQLDRIEVLR